MMNLSTFNKYLKKKMLTQYSLTLQFSLLQQDCAALYH